MISSAAFEEISRERVIIGRSVRLRSAGLRPQTGKIDIERGFVLLELWIITAIVVEYDPKVEE
jgi:hypothetical protein